MVKQYVGLSLFLSIIKYLSFNEHLKIVFIDRAIALNHFTIVAFNSWISFCNYNIINFCDAENGITALKLHMDTSEDSLSWLKFKDLNVLAFLLK